MIKYNISVLVPVYNTSAVLKRCIDSVLRQKGIKFEIIIVDDCSTDESIVLIQKYLDNSNIKLIKHKTNRGLLQARLSAIRHASGDYILFLDSDDELVDDFGLQYLHNISVRDNIDILHFKSEIFDSIKKGRMPFDWSRPYCKRVESKYALNKMVLDRSIDAQIWGKLYKSKVVHSAVLDLELPNGLNKSEDFLFNSLFFMHAHSYLGIEEVFYRYNYGIGMTSKSVNLKSIDEWKKKLTGFFVLDFIARYFENCNLDELAVSVKTDWVETETESVLWHFVTLDKSILSPAIDELFASIVDHSQFNRFLLENFHKNSSSSVTTSYFSKFFYILRDKGVYAAISRTFRFFRNCIFSFYR